MPRDIEKGLSARFFHYLAKLAVVMELLDTLDATLECAEQRGAVNTEDGTVMPW